MPITAYQHSLSAAGYVPDMAHGELPPTAWTDGQNMRFDRGAPRTIEGSEATYSITSSLVHAFNAYTDTTNYWLGLGLTSALATDGTTIADVTRVSASSTVIPYTATANKNWTTSAFGNFVIANNGVDVPQTWTPSLATPLVPLANWPATWSSAGCVRTFRNYLVALDITISSNRYPSLVAWSDAATYDALPSSWVPSTTNDAGDNNLNDTPGWIVDGLTLGGSFLIYKEDAIWAMSYVAGSTVMAFRKLFEGVGVLTRRCIQEFNGQHFFVGRGDVYVTDGVNLRSVAANRVRQYLFDLIDDDAYTRVFTAIDRTRREIWVCFPTTNGYPDKALIWNYETNQWYPPRSITPTAHIAPGIVDTSGAGATFDSSATASVIDSFDAEVGPFDLRSYNPSALDLTAVRPSKTSLYKMNSGSLENDAAITFSLTRKLLPFAGQDASGMPALWSPEMKLIRRVWLDASGTGTIFVYLGVHKHESDLPTWYGPFAVDLANQNFVWTLVRGRFFSIKFSSFSSDSEWALTGYKLEWEKVGSF